MRLLSRVASPAGFGLVLLLFFLLPFVSVSCDVPGYGEAGVDYTGSHLVSGADPSPTVPEELRDLGSDTNSQDALDEPPPDPGVQVLAIALAVLAAIGVLTVFLPRVKARLFGAAAVAGVTLVVTVVTVVVAQSNLKSTLLDSARDTGASEVEPGLPRLTDAVAEVVHTEIGFWLIVVILGVIVLATAGVGLLGGRPRMATAGGGFAGPPFAAGGPDPGAGGQRAPGAPEAAPGQGGAAVPEATELGAAGGPEATEPGAEQGYAPPAEPSAGAGSSGSGESGGGSSSPPPSDPPASSQQ